MRAKAGNEMNEQITIGTIVRAIDGSRYKVTEQRGEDYYSVKSIDGRGCMAWLTRKMFALTFEEWIEKASDEVARKQAEAFKGLHTPAPAHMVYEQSSVEETRQERNAKRMALEALQTVLHNPLDGETLDQTVARAERRYEKYMNVWAPSRQGRKTIPQKRQSISDDDEMFYAIAELQAGTFVHDHEAY